MNCMLILADVLEVLALIIQVICVGLPYWFGKSPRYYGLFEICASVAGDDYVCRSYGAYNMSQADWLGATAGLEIVTLALMFFALIVGFVICCMRWQTILYVLAALLAIFAGISGTVALIVFGAKFWDDTAYDGNDLHASFYLAIAATVLTLIAGICYIIAKPKSTVDPYED